MFTVAPNSQIIEQLGLKNSSRKLIPLCAISYLFCLYLILYVGIQIFNVIEWKILRLYLNRPYIYTEKETQVQAIDTTYLPIPLHMSANFSNAVYSSFSGQKSALVYS